MPASKQAPVFVVSGGVGASGEQLVRTVLAQFKTAGAAVKIIPHVQTEAQVTQAIQAAAGAGGIVVHSMVNPALRQMVIEQAEAKNLPAVDLVGPLMGHLSAALGQQPVGQPGLYRQSLKSYFNRIEAIEYTLDVDDGQKRHRWPEAEIILLGPSRVGKTPTSLYMSILGWKVANIPLIPNTPLPPEFRMLDMRCVVGLTIEPGQLVHHRRHRQRQLGVARHTDYIDPVHLFEEVDAAERLCKKLGVAVVDVTNKPIETVSDEVISAVNRRLGR